MVKYNTWEELIAESESNMEKLSQDKDSCFCIYEKMHKHFDFCLSSKDYFQLLDLLPYFENPEAYPQLHHSGETMRINFYLHILKCEQTHQKKPFVSSVSNYEEFTSQYTLTLFALRRLELMLSEESINEAIDYLTSIPLNVYVARIIVENEYFENYKNIYWNLYSCMKNIWSIPDQIQWLVCLAEKEPSTNVSLEIAHLYLRTNNISRAFFYLAQIPSPTPEIQSLISSLKELLPNEQS